MAKVMVVLQTSTATIYPNVIRAAIDEHEHDLKEINRKVSADRIMAQQ
jgi:hypothetical protein